MIIKNLISSLEEESYVYVNDVGLFQKVFHPAQIKKNMVIPPHYSVELDNQSEGSGYAFILSVSQKEQILIVDADMAVRKWVEQLKEQIKAEKKVHIDKLGTFSLKKGELVLKGDDIAELNEEFEGMDPISLTKEPDIKPVAAASLNAVPTEAIVNEEPIAEPEPVVVEPTYEPQPIAEEPTYEPQPIAEEPTYEPQPIAEEPTYEPEPVVEEPTYEPQTIAEEPTYEPEPVAEEPTYEPQTIAEEPTYEPQPVAEEPTYEPQPIAEEPTYEPQPVAEEPTYKPQPVAEEPTYEPQPIAEEPTYEPQPVAEEESPIQLTPVEEETNDEDNPAEDEPEEEPYKKRSRKWEWVLLFIILLLCGMGIAGYFFREQLIIGFQTIKEKFQKESILTDSLENREDERFIQIDEEPATPVFEEDTLEIAPSAETSTEPASNEATVEKPVVPIPTPAPTPKPAANTVKQNLPKTTFESGKFYVVHGSFTTTEGCATHVQQHGFKRYSPTIVTQSGSNRMRVCLGTFNTEEEAQQFITNSNIQGAWVLK